MTEWPKGRVIGYGLLLVAIVVAVATAVSHRSPKLPVLTPPPAVSHAQVEASKKHTQLAPPVPKPKPKFKPKPKPVVASQPVQQVSPYACAPLCFPQFLGGHN